MLRLKDILKTSLKRFLEVCVVYLFFSIFSAHTFCLFFLFLFFYLFFYLYFLTISLEIQNIVFLNIMLILILKHFCFILQHVELFISICYAIKGM